MQELSNPLAEEQIAKLAGMEHCNTPSDLSVTGVVTCCSYGSDSCRLKIALPHSMIALLAYNLPPILVSHARQWHVGAKICVRDAAVIRHDVGVGVYHLRRSYSTDLELYERSEERRVGTKC